MESERQDIGWVLRRVRLPGQAGVVDLAICGSRIAATGANLACTGARELDLGGRLLLPGFVDAHMHLDKVLALESTPLAGSSLDSAISAFVKWRRSVTPEAMYHNARRVAERALLHGTVALRTHVTVDRAAGLSFLEVLSRLRRELAERLTIQIVAFPESAEVDSGEALPLLREAMAAGADLLGGAPARSTDPQRFIDTLLDLAGELGCDVDLHVDESDDPRDNTLEYLAERVIASGFPGRVAAGHCCALSALDEAPAARVVERVAQAGIHVISLPSCNMYLMGRNDRGLIRRGLTRVRELLAAGVNVSIASDNIRDAFNPYGDGDMLQEMLIAGHALHLGAPAELELLAGMATYAPARLMGLPRYGLEAGDEASFVVLDAPDLGQAIAECTPRPWVFSSGQLVARTTVTREWW